MRTNGLGAAVLQKLGRLGMGSEYGQAKNEIPNPEKGYLSDPFSGDILKFCFVAEQRAVAANVLLPGLPKMASEPSDAYVPPVDCCRALSAETAQYL